jgi:hypothetical protein
MQSNKFDVFHVRLTFSGNWYNKAVMIVLFIYCLPPAGKSSSITGGLRNVTHKMTAVQIQRGKRKITHFLTRYIRNNIKSKNYEITKTIALNIGYPTLT